MDLFARTASSRIKVRAVFALQRQLAVNYHCSALWFCLGKQYVHLKRYVKLTDLRIAEVSIGVPPNNAVQTD